MITPVTNTKQSGGTTDTPMEPAFALRFNHAINSFLLSKDDFEVERVATDGSSVNATDNTMSITESIDATDPSSRSLVASLTRPLGEGTYRLVLKRGNNLLRAGDETTSKADQSLNTFTVGGSATAASQPVNLGTITSGTTAAYLPVGSSLATAQATRVTLASRSGWSLSSTFGSQDPDDFQINLYDAQDRLVTSALGADLNLINDQLTSGSYTIKIFRSDRDANPTRGSVRVTINALLTETAVPAIKSLRALNFNGTSPNPDSVEVQFAGKDLPQAMLRTSASVYSLTDDQGRVWPITPSAYDPDTNTLALLFSNYLPTGHYTVQVTAGEASGSSTGPATVTTLGSFDAVFHDLVANDLGTVFPSGSDVPAFQNTTELAPGQSTTQFISIVRSDHYQLTLSNDAVTSEVVQVDHNSSMAADSSLTGDPANSVYHLNPGRYQIIATNHTSTPQRVAFAVSVSRSSRESLSLGGVGQMPATNGNLFLIGGVAATPADATGVVASGFRTTAGGSNETQNPSPSVIVPVESSGSFSLVGLSQEPVGSLSTPSVALTQPAANSAVVAVALNSTVSLYSGTPLGDADWICTEGPPVLKHDSVAKPSEVTGEPTEPSGRRVPAVHLERTQADGESGLRAETAVEAFSGEPTSPEAVATVPGPLVADPARYASGGGTLDESAPDSDSAPLSVEVAGLASPLGFIVAGCVVYRRIKLARSVANLSNWTRPWKAGRWI